MIQHAETDAKELRNMIRRKEIRFGGNSRLRIYGALPCGTGKRLKKKNRVFFKTENEAIEHDYRPCGHCMKAAYKKWKNGIIQ